MAVKRNVLLVVTILFVFGCVSWMTYPDTPNMTRQRISIVDDRTVAQEESKPWESSYTQTTPKSSFAIKTLHEARPTNKAPDDRTVAQESKPWESSYTQTTPKSSFVIKTLHEARPTNKAPGDRTVVAQEGKSWEGSYTQTTSKSSFTSKTLHENRTTKLSEIYGKRPLVEGVTITHPRSERDETLKDDSTIKDASLGGSVQLEENAAIFHSSTLQPPKVEVKQLHNNSEYIINTDSCKILNLDPWDPTIMKYIKNATVENCIGPPELTYRRGDWIYFRDNLWKDLTEKESIVCSYQEMIRKSDDNGVEYGKTVPIDVSKGFRLKHDFIVLLCLKPKDIVYKAFYATIIEDKVKYKTKLYPSRVEKTNPQESWNILLLATDSMSRSSGLRYMPKTIKYLKEKRKAFDFRGNTKVGLNTFPNMVPFLTGYHASEIDRDRKYQYDYMPLLFKNYSKEGYITMYAEDCPYMGTFNYMAKGFHDPPTDYYIRPGIRGLEKDKTIKRDECVEKLAQTRYLFGYLSEFLHKMVHRRFFALSFSVGLSHDYISESRHLDYIYPELFREMEELGLWNNTIVLFFGDHGARWGGITTTEVGSMEGRLPMLFMAFPDDFHQKYPDLVTNLKTNTRRLTTVFDIHRTLEDILYFTGEVPIQDPNSRSQSLFAEITPRRTCEAAGIEEQYCVCHQNNNLDKNSPLAWRIARYLVKYINYGLRNDTDQCLPLQVHNIESLKRQDGFIGLPTNITQFHTYQVTFYTIPGYAFFEGTVIEARAKTGVPKRFEIQGEIARLNLYGDTSSCVTDNKKRLYCYCKFNLIQNTSSSQV